MLLRPYQQNACNAALTWMRGSVDPCLIDAAPAAGKSYMIAYIANELHKISGGKRVLCLAPSAELVKQNFEKFILTGERASIFSASAGVKSTRNVVVFGTPGTVKNAISRFCQPGANGFCAVLCDEAHGMTPTIRAIIEAMREANPMLRVLGLSGTPFVLGKGYIFRQWAPGPDGAAKVNGDSNCRDPYFTACVYRVSAREMLDGGFIAPMVIGQIGNADAGDAGQRGGGDAATAYDTSGIEMLPNGQLNHATVERAFEGHGRKTAAIVADVIDKARDRRGGVMYFAATIRHAQEVLASLPPETSALVTGDVSLWNGKEMPRKAVIAAYRKQEVRHLVNVGVLTTGFDVAHTETIALLRYTESAALLQQILGRAWRMMDGKADSLLLDYASNVDRHFPDGDIYNPDIKAGKGPGDGAGIEAACPDCRHVNEFSLNLEYADYQRDVHGYCLDVFGKQLMSDHGPIAAHYGRRCFGQLQTGPQGTYERCNYRWTSKECPHCGEANDIAARYCCACKGEIIDPNEKLAMEFRAMKRDPTRRQTDKVVSVEIKEGLSARGNKTVRADWITPFRQFSTWHLPDAAHSRGMADWQAFARYLDTPPETITYQKDDASGFFRVLAYNRPADEELVRKALLPASQPEAIAA
jgi:DNA repair protein RadD